MDDRSRSWFFHQDHKPHHQKSLDGLRGIAVILVLLSHASNNNFFFWEGITFYGIGKGGVYLFFTLSAFLLDQQIIHALTTGNANTFFWKRYLLRRILRIMPLLLVSLIAFYLLFHCGVTSPIQTAGDVLCHFLLLDGKSIFWSVPVEFKYYVISPFLLLVCHKFMKWDLKKIGLFFISLVILTLAYEVFIGFHKLNTLKYLIVFLSGTYIAVFTYHSTLPVIQSSLISSFGFIALLLCLLTNPTYADGFLGISVVNNGRQIMIVYAVLCFIMVYAAVHGINAFSDFLQMRWLRFVGIISFSVYLFHMPVIQIIKKDIFFIPDGIKIYVFILITIIVSTITYLCIERPLSRIMSGKVLTPSGPAPLP